MPQEYSPLLEFARLRLIVAIDNQPDIKAAQELVASLSGHVGIRKIGLELREMLGFSPYLFHNYPIMYDTKMGDIPNTVGNAIKQIAQNQPHVMITTVHAMGGLDMLKAAAQYQRDNFFVAAITVLTSLSNEDARALYFNNQDMGEHFDYRYEAVMRLTTMAFEAGCKAVVCSAHEVKSIKATFPELTTIVPGIRLADSDHNDQKAVATPYQAIRNGAHYLVVGRDITQPSDGRTPAQAADFIVSEIARAMSDQQ